MKELKTQKEEYQREREREFIQRIESLPKRGFDKFKEEENKKVAFESNREK